MEEPLLDLATEDGAKAYRRELARVAWRLRLAGFSLVLFGAIWALMARYSGYDLPGGVFTGFGLMLAGWAVFLYVIFVRMRYHSARMARLLQSKDDV